MLNVLVPLEQTRVYQENYAKGEGEGKVEGQIEGKVDSLKRLLSRRYGVLPPLVGQTAGCHPAGTTRQLNIHEWRLLHWRGLCGLVEKTACGNAK
jgi:hypothetical protein